MISIAGPVQVLYKTPCFVVFVQQLRSEIQLLDSERTIQLETAPCYQHYFCNTELRTAIISKMKRTFDSDTKEHVCIIYII